MEKQDIRTGGRLPAGKGLLLSLDHSEFRILQLLSGAVQKMSEGELLQIEKARTLNLEESVYFEIIRNKTASLLASSCAAGAYSTAGMKTYRKAEKVLGKPLVWHFKSKMICLITVMRKQVSLRVMI